MGRRPDFEWLRQDARHKEHLSWAPWLREIASARRRFAKVLELDPMTNETASVSVLASAASSVGLLSLAEYTCLKRQVANGRAYGNGRVDLWIADARRRRSWAFEAKQVICRPGTRVATLKKQLARAAFEASRIPAREANRRLGLLIAVASDEARTAKLEACMDELARVSQFACRCGGGSGAIYLFFRRASRTRRLDRMSGT